MPDKPAKRDPNGLKSVHKTVAVLDCFSRNERSLSVADVAEKTGLPKTTAHRILATLREIGFVEQEREREQYRLGIRLFELGSVVLDSMDLPREAAPFVERLIALSGEGSHLCVFDGAHVVTVDHREPDGGTGHRITTILAAPAYCTGVGKAALAFQSEETISRIIQAGLQRYTRTTITEPDELRSELAEIREQGYAVDNCEHEVGLRCVAAPIRNAAGDVFAAISVSGPQVRITDDRVPALAELVMDIAERISRRLGYAGPSHALRSKVDEEPDSE
ncbi:MAG: IclR family transcriptional regulator [Rhodospirillales bacterium]|nr:IclR family transcriptional regulator [Rhodospirillales bacterium]